MRQATSNERITSQIQWDGRDGPRQTDRTRTSGAESEAQADSGVGRVEALQAVLALDDPDLLTCPSLCPSSTTTSWSSSPLRSATNLASRSDHPLWRSSKSAWRANRSMRRSTRASIANSMAVAAATTRCLARLSARVRLTDAPHIRVMTGVNSDLTCHLTD